MSLQKSCLASVKLETKNFCADGYLYADTFECHLDILGYIGLIHLDADLFRRLAYHLSDILDPYQTQNKIFISF